MASTYLSRSLGSSETSTQIGTFSFWLKRGFLSGNTNIFYSNEVEDTDNRGYLAINSDDTFLIVDTLANVNHLNLKTNRLARDTSAWYHVVLAIDTTQATSSNRAKLYINGVQETSFSTETYPSQNANLKIFEGGQTNKNYIGGIFGASAYWDGSMSHIHYIDGTAYDASAFGLTDPTTGEWKIKSSPSVTYGNNGFFILKDGNSVTDQSGNGNNFTVSGGTLTNTEDCPSNIFATGNPLDVRVDGGTNYAGSFSNGNNTVSGTSSGVGSVTNSTLAMNSGKFYCEYKLVADSGGNTVRVGIISKDDWSTQGWPFNSTENAGYAYKNDGNKENNGSSVSYGASWTVNDIIGIAFDVTNGTLEFYKNGTSQGQAFTGITSNKNWVFTCTPYLNVTFSSNFGNGYFGTTAVSSAGTNASGIGIFEYDVPTGYTALSTKGLNE